MHYLTSGFLHKPFPHDCITIIIIQEYVDRILDIAYANGLSVLLDVHAMKGSQNGFDNSGQSLGFQWTTAIGFEYAVRLNRLVLIRT